ncbi:conserved hypothetical protein [Leishmania mexicana MHOM/GT/2001/U1103]|uniref:Uncharacterized protein n=1 Tax=Leishmania mexicana (strain MHOM/GT/2001/U1103) TaxID=929439 RepID=E9AQK9_LEIMU|nr:conserved hypothetical protein [Leishmania mexicana MHOM/GT/2001/U1103]CBZ25228.1 conserved hypothetical protein [Leishmania mexicana MHOM/GT/2001/U1103]
MNFSFPHFTRASTDKVYPEPPQKSLLELVIEAKGRLGLVPQRHALKQHPSSSPFSRFSDSDEEGEGVDSSATEAEARQDAVLTTRTSWVPPAYLLDYFFSGEFLAVFLTLHSISASRPVSALVPPLLTVRDAQLHPLVEAGLCAFLQDAAHSSFRQQRSGGGGGWRDGARGGRGGRDGGERSYTESNAAAASADGSFMRYWGGAQQHQLQGGVLGAGKGNDNGAAEPSAPGAAHPSCVDAQRRVDEPAATPLGERLLFRGLQQVALPALLLGDHVLLSGPRGIGKRTAALLAAGANVLALTSNADSGAAEETDVPLAPVEGEGEAAADKPPAAAEGSASTFPTEAQVKPEEAMEDNRDAADARPDSAEPAAASDPASAPAPRALIILSSYPEVLSAAHWLGSVFGPAAFAPYTFQKDGVALRPLLEAHTAEQQPAVLDGGNGAYSSDALGHVGVTPTFPEVTSGRRFIGPPLSLPFITDTTGAAGAAALLPADPTQTESAPLHAEATVPGLSELAALVMNAPLPAEAAGTAQGSAGERANGGDTRLQRRRHREDEGVRDDGADEERAERRSSHAHHRHRRHRSERAEVEGEDDEIRRARHREKRSPRSSSRHRHRSRHGDRSDRGEEAESRGERDASGHRSHRRHRRRSDEVDGGDGGKDRRPVDDEERHSQAYSSHRRSSRRHRHHSSSGSVSYRHRSRSEERLSRHRSRRHHHHRSRRHHRDRHGEDRRSVSSSSSSSSTTASSTSSPGCQSAGLPPLMPTNAEAVLPMMLDNSVAPPAADELRALALDSVVPSAVPMEAPVAPFSAVAVVEEPPAASAKEQQAAKEDSTAELSDVLSQRVPLLITTYHALGMALGMVQGEASALPPLEHVRVALFVNLERVLMPPLKESFVHSWWLSLVNALDVECQFVVTADRMGNEVRGFLDSTIIPDAGERLVRFDQRDASIWAMMNVQVCAVPVEVPVAASPPNGGSEGRPRISGSDIDAAKVTHLFSTIAEHISSTGCHATHERGVAAFEAHRGGQGARVVVVCSARREQSLVVTQLQRLFHDQEHDTRAAMVRVTESVELFRASEAEVLVLTDAQLTDPRVLRDVHQCTEVDLIVHFSLPRTVMTQLEKKEIIDLLAQRGRAILGSSKQFCARRWWRGTAAASAAGGGTASGVPSNAVNFVPAKVECQLLLTEHNVHGRAGSCVMEALREVSDS